MNKARIAESFSRAAHTYDKAAHLQREIGKHLLTLIPALDNVGTVVDLGCGTGFFTKVLHEKFPNANIVGLDIAQGMLNFAKAENKNAICWLCADAEQLPFHNNSIDLIFSSLAIQWCQNLRQVLVELRRALKHNGVAVLSTLGSATLVELKKSWEQVDKQPHVNQFLSVSEIKKQIEQFAFAEHEIVKEFKVLKYSSPIELMRELKELGAHEVINKQATGLMGKKRLYSFLNGYQLFEKEGCFPATYEVIYIVIKK